MKKSFIVSMLICVILASISIVVFVQPKEEFKPHDFFKSLTEKEQMDFIDCSAALVNYGYRSESAINHCMLLSKKLKARGEKIEEIHKKFQVGQ